MAIENFGKNVRRLVGVAGLSALSLMGSKTEAQTFQDRLERFFYPKLENVEYEADELKSDPDLKKKIALYLAEQTFSQKETIRKDLEESVGSMDKMLEIIKEELKYRQENRGNPLYFKELSTPKILEHKKWSEECKKKKQDDIEVVKNWEQSKNVPDSLVNEKIKNIENNILLYDTGRKWVLDNLKNPEYIQRLKKEMDSDDLDLTTEDWSEHVQDELLSRTDQIADSNFIVSRNIKESVNGTKNLFAFYQTFGNNVYLPANSFSDSFRNVSLAIHEFSHKVTKANEHISSKVISLFEEAFDSVSVAKYLSSPDNFLDRVVYLSDPTEMYARKKVFEYDLERLGIKKYGEKFTIDHYKKVLELQKNLPLDQGFSGNSDQFLLIIKPEMMEKVMNEIAENEVAQDNSKA
ncbi:MAG: hypothetical protein AAB913_01530 [Patescibacteria group bacterium]